MIYFAVDRPRTAILDDYLVAEPALRDRVRQVTYPELFRTRTLERATWVFTSLDALSEAERQLVSCLQDAARAAGMCVLNDARKALRRFDLLEELRRLRVNDFRAHRASGSLDAIRFPVFVREADDHNGSLTRLLKNRAELRRAMLYLRLRGFEKRELLVVEFCETISADSLYRKYSVFRIGGAYVPRFLQAGLQWMAKQASRTTDPALIAEDLDFVRTNPHAEWVRQVFETAAIEYGRLDYGVGDGPPQAWEINLTPVIVGNPARGEETPRRREIRALTGPAKQIVLAGLREAFLAIDQEFSGRDPIPVDFPRELERVAERERRESEKLARRRRRIDALAASPAFGGIGRFVRGQLF